MNDLYRMFHVKKLLSQTRVIFYFKSTKISMRNITRKTFKMFAFACKFMTFFSISLNLRNCNDCNYRIRCFASRNVEKYISNLLLTFNFEK